MVGLVVTTENEMFLVEYDSPHYDVIQEAVGGWYEHVRPVGLDRPYCMMVNEAGLLLNLPLNLLGSILYGALQHGQIIVGNIIFLKEGESNGERDAFGMTEEEARSLGNKFSTLPGGLVHWAKKG